MLKKFSINRLLVLFATIAFAFFTIDSAIEHKDVLHKEAMAYVPIVFGFIGLLLGTIAVIQWKNSIIKAFQLFLILSIFVGVLGFYLHVKEDDDDDAKSDAVKTEQQEKDKPPLAPLSFAGVGILGLLGTARKWPAEVVEK